MKLGINYGLIMDYLGIKYLDVTADVRNGEKPVGILARASDGLVRVVRLEDGAGSHRIPDGGRRAVGWWVGGLVGRWVGGAVDDGFRRCPSNAGTTAP